MDALPSAPPAASQRQPTAVADAAARPRSAAVAVPGSGLANGGTHATDHPGHLGGWKLITTGSSSMAPPARAQPGSQQECCRSWLTASPATIR